MPTDNFFENLVTQSKVWVYTAGSLISGGAIAFQEKISVITAIASLLCMLITALSNLYFNIQRNKREQKHSQEESVFIERRMHEIADSGQRRRESDMVDKMDNFYHKRILTKTDSKTSD